MQEEQRSEEYKVQWVNDHLEVFKLLDSTSDELMEIELWEVTIYE